MSDHPRFSHTQLDESNRQIRLLRIDRSSDSKCLQITLHHFDFEHGSHPPYRALSYTWGPSLPTEDIHVNGGAFTIRENLFHFLDQARMMEFFDEQYLWIDQICIDQTTISERNHQVGFMGEIYQEAEEVVVWLGKEADGSATAMETINALSDSFSVSEVWQHKHEIQALFTRPYWNRLWIVQEIVLGKGGKIVCGHSMISMMDLIFFLGHLCRPRHATLSSEILSGTSRNLVALREERLGANSMRFLGSLVYKFIHLQCEVPRDHIFGLLGLLPPDQRFPVDYEIPPLLLVAQIINTQKRHLDGINTSISPLIGLAKVMLRLFNFEEDDMYSDLDYEEAQFLCKSFSRKPLESYARHNLNVYLNNQRKAKEDLGVQLQDSPMTKVLRIVLQLRGFNPKPG